MYFGCCYSIFNSYEEIILLVECARDAKGPKEGQKIGEKQGFSISLSPKALIFSSKKIGYLGTYGKKKFVNFFLCSSLLQFPMFIAPPQFFKLAKIKKFLYLQLQHFGVHIKY